MPERASDVVTAPSGALREDPRGWPDRRFWARLSTVAAAGLAWRVAYVLTVTRHENSKLYDSLWYEGQAFVLASGHFFPVLFGVRPDAAHPPLAAFVLVPVTWLFGLPPGFTPQRLTMAVLGALVVVTVGLLGRRLGGDRAGLAAALLAAAYPNMWIPNGIIMSETVTMLSVGLVLLATYRLLDAPTLGSAALVGLACGLAMLSRAELVLLVPVLLVPAALTRSALPRGRRILLAAAGVAVAGLVVGPWVGRNLATFEDPTFLSTGLGPVLLGANCPATDGGPGLGSWDLACSVAVPPAADQSVESARQTAAGVAYARRHARRLPLVVAARVGRVWDLYQPMQMVRGDVDEGRPVPASFAGLLAYYALLPVALVGVVALRRRRVPVWPMLAIAAVVTVVAATGYGQVRFRAEFEVALVVLAAVGLLTCWRALGDRRGRHAAARAGTPSGTAVEAAGGPGGAPRGRPASTGAR